MSVLRFLLLLGIITFIVFPASVGAHEFPYTPLVTCSFSGPPCTDLCELFHTGQHILSFIIFVIAIPAATIGILIGAVLLLISGGNEALVNKGRNAIKFAVAGLAVILVSFIVINSILVAIANPGAFPWPIWYKISC